MQPLHQLTHLVVGNSIDSVLGASTLSQLLQVWGSVGRVAAAGSVKGGTRRKGVGLHSLVESSSIDSMLDTVALLQLLQV